MKKRKQPQVDGLKRDPLGAPGSRQRHKRNAKCIWEDLSLKGYQGYQPPPPHTKPRR